MTMNIHLNIITFGKVRVATFGAMQQCCIWRFGGTKELKRWEWRIRL